MHFNLEATRAFYFDRSHDTWFLLASHRCIAWHPDEEIWKKNTTASRTLIMNGTTISQNAAQIAQTGL
jgi:hypothetical protein